MASSAYKNKTGLPFLFSFCLKFFNKLSENVGEAAGRARSCWRRLSGGDSLLAVARRLHVHNFVKSCV